MSQRLLSSIEGGFDTVRKWESEDLLICCRQTIPFDTICPEQFYQGLLNKDKIHQQQSPYAEPDDYKYAGDDLFLKRLTLYFKQSMTWVNNPPCELCGSKETKCRSTRKALTPEERDGEASRVEIYFCLVCNAETTSFPRYNSPKKLLETRKGRCGEYANLFGLVCRSVGFETRYVKDFTDHVWVEVWSNETNRWIMADGCEGKIDEPGMYEKGWGKNLCYNLAFTIDSVADVTRRYTRKFNTHDFQARRRQFSPNEMQSDTIIAQANTSARNRCNLTASRIEELNRRELKENEFLDDTLKQQNWGDGAYSEGRLSGSLDWKVSRGEAGGNQDEDMEGNREKVNEMNSKSLQVECFHPLPYRNQDCTIVVSAPPQSKLFSHPDCINVMGVSCGAGLPKSVSIVIIDEKHSCILQSRIFHNWIDASTFLASIPDERIIVICADATLQADETIEKNVSRLGNFDMCLLHENIDDDDNTDGKHFLYIGQVDRAPVWATCKVASPEEYVEVTLSIHVDDSLSGLKLQRKIGFTPQMISFRLPNEFMSFQSQEKASEEDKKTVFSNFMEKEVAKNDCRTRYVGFVTKEGAPIYLLSKEAFPLQKNDTIEKASTWNTYHYVPEPMWYEEKYEEEQTPDVDVPIDEQFFTSVLGPSLVRNESGSLTEVSTVTALSKSRLVALYFSAHWCPPCRRFTPMLCEMYMHLKEVYPMHGLEVVFVSGDRDESSFRNYVGSMPWLSMPWNAVGNIQRAATSRRLSVNGIPALIVFDTISGNIVVSKEVSKIEVTQACQVGEDAIEQLLEKKWFERIPFESKNLMEVLSLSCTTENMNMECDDVNNIDSNSYLERSHESESLHHKPATMSLSNEAQSQRVKDYFLELVAQGCSPNEAAAKAINKVAEDLKVSKDKKILSTGEIQATTKPEGSKENSKLYVNDNLKFVWCTAKRYLINVERQPYTPRFRKFRVSTNAFDNIASSEEGMLFVRNQVGLRIYNNGVDFMASIPLCLDVTATIERIDDAMKEM